ncbi:hypothetical protein GGR77_002834 [Xanthomonas translucens]
MMEGAGACTLLVGAAQPRQTNKTARVPDLFVAAEAAPTETGTAAWSPGALWERLQSRRDPLTAPPPPPSSRLKSLPQEACGSHAGCTVGAASAATDKQNRQDSRLRSSRLKPLLKEQELAACSLGALWEGLQSRRGPVTAPPPLHSSRLKSLPQEACGSRAGCTVGGTSVPTRSTHSTSTASLVATEVAPTRSLRLARRVHCRSGFSRDRQTKSPGFPTCSSRLKPLLQEQHLRPVR